MSVPAVKKGGKPKGSPKSGGRKKGTPNKIPASLAADILAAYKEIGGVTWLVSLAYDKPELFSALLAKVLPRNPDLALKSDSAINIVFNLPEKNRTQNNAINVTPPPANELFTIRAD